MCDQGSSSMAAATGKYMVKPSTGCANHIRAVPGKAGAGHSRDATKQCENGIRSLLHAGSVHDKTRSVGAALCISGLAREESNAGASIKQV